MAIWPTSLPCMMLGATENKQDGALRSSMDAGPQKVRRRFSAVSRYVSVSITLDATQRGTLDAFFADTLAQGSLAFDGDDPFGGSTVEMRFLAPPAYTYAGKDGGQARWYYASLSLEILP